MDKDYAKVIIEKNQLIPKKISKSILKAIQNNDIQSCENLSPNISIALLNQLRQLYIEKEKQLKHHYSDDSFPRNLPFYYILKDKIPSFRWEVLPSKKDHVKHVTVFSPRVQNLRVSLLSLLIDQVDLTKDTLLHHHFGCMDDLPPDMGMDLSYLFEKIQVLLPDYENMEHFVSYIKKGMNGETLTLFSPVCPDYSVEKTNDPQIPYVHTFNDIGCGVGLLAQRVMNALPYLDIFFRKYNINIQYIIAIADFEAWSEDNLKRLDITTSDFLSRIKESVTAIQKNLMIPATTLMFLELCGGYESWKANFDEFLSILNEMEFGNANITRDSLIEIVKARKSLYDRWQGVRNSLEDYFPQLLNQGAEYAVMGLIISQKYKNCIVLGADHPSMAPFYNMHQFIPSLYLKRFYG